MFKFSFRIDVRRLSFLGNIFTQPYQRFANGVYDRESVEGVETWRG